MFDIKKLYADDSAYVLRSWARKPEAPIIVKGERVYVWDIEGSKHMDFASQLVNVNVGHRHPKIIEAIKRQAEEMPYVAPSYCAIPVIELAKQLAELTPGDLTKCFFTTGGGEAVETAVKGARLYTKRFKVMALWLGFHGGSMGTLSLTGITYLRAPFEPLVYGYLHVPPPYCYRCSFGLEYPSCEIQCAKFVEEILKWEDPQTVAAFVGEPVLGAAFVVPPKEYWKIVREICNRHGLVLIFDEVMSGFGRTGKMFGCENYGIVPDILASGKGITSGHLPLGVAIFNKKIGDYLSESHFPHGYTYSGHPTCCAAGLAGIQALQEEGLVENAATVGAHLLKRLKDLENVHKCVGDARGVGLFTAIELVKDKKTKEPLLDPKSGENAASYVRQRAKERGLLVGTTTFAPSVIRLAPPLCITKEETDWAIDTLDEILSEVDSRMS